MASREFPARIWSLFVPSHVAHVTHVACLIVTLNLEFVGADFFSKRFVRPGLQVGYPSKIGALMEKMILNVSETSMSLHQKRLLRSTSTDGSPWHLQFSDFAQDPKRIMCTYIPIHMHIYMYIYIYRYRYRYIYRYRYRYIYYTISYHSILYCIILQYIVLYHILLFILY